jgi:serine/threonine protein kinase
MSTAQHRLALPAGYELGRYRFREILGSGGFGITYLAEDQTLNRRVAIKELLPNDIATRIDGTTVVAKTQSEEESLTWARQRFVDEGRALAACDHPNVVNVYEMVEANGTAYMVTKYEDGRSLEQWLRDLGRPPNETELRSILIPLLDGLETVHQAGFLHRDIKPENIYLTKNGRPVLLDFGSARQAITNRNMAMTSIVTSGYAPFEQYHEDGKQGAWSDIYALAAVMYRAITGKKPPEATRRLKDDPCEKLTGRYAGQYDAEFLRAIDKGLLVDEAKRPQSVAAWRKMFGADDRLPLDSAETRLLPRAPKPPSKIDMFADPGVIAGTVGAVLFIALIWVTVRSGTGRAIASNSTPKIIQTSPSPGEAEASPHASGMPAYSPAEITPAPSPQPSASPSQQAVAQLDPRLIGKWETGSNAPENLRKVRWEQFADGHYVFSGPISDNGVITGGDDGKFQQFSNAANQPVQVSYEFKGDKLVTNGPLGQAEWRRTGSTTSSKRQSTNTNQSTPRRGYKVRDDDIRNNVLKRVLRRFP